MLSWAVQRGTSVIPKTVRAERLEENLNLFMLNGEHFSKINSIAAEVGPIRYLDPREYIGFDVFNEAQDEPAAITTYRNY